MNKTALVIDTNIVFKVLRLQHSAIRHTLNDSQYHFYAPKFLIVELFKHKEKLLKNNTQLEDEFYEYLNLLVQCISFVNEDTIAIGSYLEAYRLCRDVDEKDVPFVALTIELDCKIWTRDQPIIDGLTAKGFTSFFDIK